MSSVLPASNSNFGFEALAVAMTKRATEAQGQAALSLLESSVQASEQINRAAASSSKIDIRV